MLVGLDRLELSTSPLSGARSSHLSYRPIWWSWSGSNRRPPECKSGALPTELQPPDWCCFLRTGGDRPRACPTGTLLGGRALFPGPGSSNFESRPVERVTIKTSSMIIEERTELEKEN